MVVAAVVPLGLNDDEAEFSDSGKIKVHKGRGQIRILVSVKP